MTARIHYVIGAYFGARHHADPRYESDPTVLVAAHLASLGHLLHSLRRVTVVVSGETTRAVDAYLSALPPSIGGADLAILRRPNVGMSYGAFSDGFVQTCGEFTHYIFTEDDYLFTQPSFDSELVGELNRRDGCGMLCGAAYRTLHDTMPHAAVFIAIARTEALAAAALRYGGVLPHDRQSARPEAGFYGQKAMSFSIQEVGYGLEDWLDRWSTAYWDSAERIARWFGRREGEPDPQRSRGDFDKPAFVVPFQAVGQRVRISDGQSWHAGVIGEDGSCVLEARP